MDEPSEIPLVADDVTTLRMLAIEGHELFLELRHAGFTGKQSTDIVAQMIGDALDSLREDHFELEFGMVDEDDDEDDTYYDGDSDI